MASIHALKNLTAEDRRKHRLVVAELRRCLFRNRQPDACFIVDEEVTLAPSIYVLFDLQSGAPQRHLMRGGLEYKFMFPQAKTPNWIGVKHWQAKLYWLYATFQDPSKLACYTRFSRLVPFHELSTRFLTCIDQLMEEHKPLPALRSHRTDSSTAPTTGTHHDAAD